MRLRLMRARNGLGSASQKEKSWVAKERWAMVRLQEINSVKRYLKVLDHDLHSIRPHWPWFEAGKIGSKSFSGCRYWPWNALKIVIYSYLFIIIHLYYIMYIALSCNSAAETKPGVQPILVKQFINKQCMLRPKPVGLFGGLISPDQPPWRILQPRTSSVVLCAELSKVVWDHNTAIQWGMSIFIIFI